MQNETLWQVSSIDIIGGFEPVTFIRKARVLVALRRHVTFEDYLASNVAAIERMTPIQPSDWDIMSKKYKV